MAKTLQLRRGTTAKRKAYIPKVGEVIFDTQENSLYVGDGSVAGGIAVGGGATLWTDWVAKTTQSISAVAPDVKFTKADVYVAGSIQIPGYNYIIANNVITFETTIKPGILIYCKLYA